VKKKISTKKREASFPFHLFRKDYFFIKVSLETLPEAVVTS